MASTGLSGEGIASSGADGMLRPAAVLALCGTAPINGDGIASSSGSDAIIDGFAYRRRR